MDPDNMKSWSFSPDCSLDKASTSSKGFISHCKNLLRAQGPCGVIGLFSLEESVGWGKGGYSERCSALQHSPFEPAPDLPNGPCPAASQHGLGPTREGEKTPPEQTPEPGWKFLNPRAQGGGIASLSGCELCCHLWMPEHHQHSRPSTSSTLLTLSSPNSLPVSLQPLLPSCAPLSPHALLSPPLPSPLTTLAAHTPPSSTSLFPYLRAPYSPSSPSLLPCLDLHPSHSRKPTGTARKLESHFPRTSFPAFTSSEEQQVM